MALPSKGCRLLLVCLTISASLFAASGPAANKSANQSADTARPSFLVLSDIHLDPTKQQAGISSLARDAGADTWAAVKQEADRLITDPTIAPRFILYLGDLPMHNGPTNISTTMFDAGKVLADLRRLATEHQLPLLYVMGNNDSPDNDYGPFSTRLFQNDTAAADAWPAIDANVIPDSDSLFKQIGCYSAYPLGEASKLRVIVLNTVLFTWNHKSPDDTAQCQEEIDWLGKQLRQVRAKGETALIAMHVPPGFDTFRHKTFWTTSVPVNHTTIQNSFLDTLGRYRTHIMGVLSSHTHMDGFKRLYDRNGQFITLLISVPAVAPSLLNNSALKLIRYNPKLQFTASVTYYQPTGSDHWQTNTVASAPLNTYLKNMDTTHFSRLVDTLYNVGKTVPNLFGLDLDVRRETQHDPKHEAHAQH